MSTQWDRIFVFSAAALTITLFALVPSTTRIAVAQIHGLDLGIIRVVGPGLLALPILLVLRLPPPRSAADWGLLIVLAGCSFVGFPLLFSAGSQSTSACHAALILAALPLFTGLFGAAIELKLPRTTWLVGAAVALAGEAALASVPLLNSPNEAGHGGEFSVLLACILFSIGTVAGARLSHRIGSLATTFWALSLASVSVIPLAALYADTIPWSALSPRTYIAILHMIVGAAICANVSWLFALSRGGIARIAPLQFAQPILAVAFAALILREQVTPQLLLAGAAIIVGIAIACRSAREPGPSGATAGAKGNFGRKMASSLTRTVQGRLQLRRARAELDAMDYRDYKDLGFPAKLTSMSQDLDSKLRR